MARPLTPQQMAEELRDRVEEKIKASFVELIDESQWRSLVEAALKRFVSKRLVKSYSGSPNYEPSPLEAMIDELLQERFRKWLKEELERPEFYGGNMGMLGEEPGEAVKKLVKELIPDIVTAAFGNFMQGALTHVRNALSQQGGF